VRISADARQYGARTTDPRAAEHFQAGIDYERRRQRDLDRSAAGSATSIEAPPAARPRSKRRSGSSDSYRRDGGAGMLTESPQAQQVPFAFAPMIEPELSAGATIEERFRAFALENGHVYDALVDLARRWRARQPNRRIGIPTLFERLRCECGMQTTGDGYRLNNSFRSLYAREIMRREPDLAGVFELRSLRSVA